MSEPTNNISVKEYIEITKYKDLKIEIEKMYHLKTTIVPLIMVALGTIKKGQINTLIRYLAALADMNYKKLLCITLREYCQCNRKIFPKSGNEKYEYIEYNHNRINSIYKNQNLSSRIRSIKFPVNLQTNHLILDGSPDLGLINKKKKTCGLMDFAEFES